MSIVKENQVKGTQILERVEDKIAWVSRSCLRKVAVCVLFQQMESMSMTIFYNSVTGFCSLQRSYKEGITVTLKNFLCKPVDPHF